MRSSMTTGNFEKIFMGGSPELKKLATTISPVNHLNKLQTSTGSVTLLFLVFCLDFVFEASVRISNGYFVT